jgi:hypothetical protein
MAHPRNQGLSVWWAELAPLSLVLAVFASGAAGCVSGGGLPPDTVEAAYREAQMPRAKCRPGDAACCATLLGEARAASDASRAAHLWEEVALACPSRRGEVAVAISGRSPSAGAGPLNVSYRLRLPPAYRLYWVSTAAGPHLLPAAAAPTANLRVEVQAMRFSGTKPGPLLALERSFDLPFEEGAAITVEIGEAGGALDVRALVDKVPLPRSRAAVPPARPAPAPRLETARAISLLPARVPSELGTLGRAPALRVCLDQDGQLDSVRFLEPAHPRVAASLIDMYRDSIHEPYRVNDRPVPSCHAVNPS